ncbi:LysM peptidoglycan-binding domain-containing protein [Flavobacterium terrae]|uniref:Amino acid/amide ABC transporter substrate-binding protein, HAAT family n=1 Tax=Flavobacterium terrae TaxID=415425 RepID=A0A1M6GKN5_9FLAO|nr:LysM peptidoglycan-binding domain-containing protein [Flavobacterium terrae]SHJ10502.1 amino acid/amide ABC transporter substrate-binding protein, HAAT family [Flavobacterium terrae]
MKSVIKVLFLLGFTTVFGQNLIKHKVAKGETVTKIAQKYSVTPSDIYKVNPDASKGVEENTILLIPNKSAVPTKKEVAENKPKLVLKKHEVKPKETLYGISTEYGITIQELEKANVEALKDGLKIGLVLNIPVKLNSGKQEVKNNNALTQKAILHTVEPKETKYGIAKQYGITVEELEKKNPEIKDGLKIGFQLLIKGERPKQQVSLPIVVKEEPKIQNPTSVVDKVLGTDEYIVKPKETLYSLAAQFGVSQEKLIELNPELKEGLKEGMTIKVPSNDKPTVIVTPNRQNTDLTKTIKKGGNKKLAMLLPFNIEKLDNDTVNSTKSRLKKDKFLNMTLDFYSGALMAIDSAKTLGIDVDIAIYDSNESKSNSDVADLIQSKNLKAMNAVIGPFYQNNAEKAASLLGEVPVISPLSKDYDKKFPNLIQATPTNDDVRLAMFDFMREKGGNMIAVVDPKKGSSKQYISENHKDVLFATVSDAGSLDVVSLKALLVKDKMNYVILETEKTNLILSTTSALLSSLKEYQINLVILGENSALDYEEIQMDRLTKLNMHYPSMFRINDSDAATDFESAYRKKNKVLPNQFATRGFDVTFDVLMRLSQEKTLSETINETATEQVESKFNYAQNPEGGYINKGIYILFYDTDLTVKQAN